jgi:putative heme-binding domain-containing protein
MIRISTSPWSVAALLATVLVIPAVLLSYADDGANKNAASDADSRQAFATNCAGCHGLDGSGTQRAPNIGAGARIQNLPTDQVFRIIADGVPGTGMPSFRSLGEARIKTLVEFVKQLQGTKSAASVPGDAARGKQIFFGENGCSSCHMVSGEGGFIGPDLTDYAAAHDTNAIRLAITTPSARSGLRQVTAIAKNGTRYSGIVRNEDNFSLQLLSPDGKFYFLSKADLQGIERDQKSLMPSDYGSKLSAGQLDDLVSYLTSVSRSSKSATVKDKDSDED